jgi:protocatechuate 3,4-dioxygenase beta subunit
MSTKTTFKRIALVAVAALTLGSFSVVSASAAPSAAYTTMYDTTNGYQVLGGQATVTISVDTSTVTSVVLSGVGSVLSSSVGTNTPTISGSPTSGSWYITGGSGGVSTSAVVLTSSVAGTSTLTMTPLGANGAPGTAVTKTITWAASFATKSVSAATSTSILNATTGTTATADATVVADKAAGRAATVKVTLLDANSAAVNDLSLSATVAGSGLIKASTDGTANGDARATSVTLTGTNVGYIAVNSDGTNGVATITISAGSTVIATETVTFSGAAATYVAAQTRKVYAGTTAPSTPGAQTITVTVTDAAGNKVVDGTTVYASSATTTVATIGSSATTTSGVATFIVTGAAAGTSVITFGNAASTPTVSTTTTIIVGSATIAAVKVAANKGTYLPGEQLILTTSVTSADGKPVADGIYTVFSTAPTSTMALSAGTLPVASLTLSGGAYVATLNAPLAEGDFAIAGVDNLTALNAVSAKATVVNTSVSAATDAANEATDAANAATDAALAAADAADAATAAAQDASDAVAALSATVAKLVASLKAQITSLTNLVIKIQKKVKA